MIPSSRSLLNRLLAVIVMTATFSAAEARSLRVAPEETGENVFPTIQAAADAVQPGDEVEIASGIYFETVNIRASGSAAAPIRFRPVENGFVQVNAGRPLKLSFQPVAQWPDVCVATVSEPFPEASQTGLWEMPARLRLARVASAADTARRPGSWFYDREAKKLYLRSSGGIPPEQLNLWLEAPEASAITIDGSHIHLSRLEVTLGRHGVLVDRKAGNVTVEECRAYCNSEAGFHVTGDHHRLHRNEAFENNGYGIQLRYGVNYAIVTKNRCFHNGPNNGEVTASSVPTDLGIYSKGSFNRFEGNFIDGIHEDTFRNKSGHGHNQLTVFRNNVARGNLTTGPYGIFQNTFLVSGLGMRAGMYRNGGKPNPMRTWEKVDPLGQQRQWNLIHPLADSEDPHFADPEYDDFRLQADTPYPGKGAFPGPDPVFYIDPANGRDTASGLSLADPLATPAAALSRAVTGATLYLLPGEYRDPVEIVIGGLDEENPLRLRAWGKKPGVILSGGLKITGAPRVEVEGVELSNATVEVADSPAVTFRNVVFTGPKAGIHASGGSHSLRVVQSTFRKNAMALQVEQSPFVTVLGSVFSDCATLIKTDEASRATLTTGFNIADRFRAEVGTTAIASLKAWQEQRPALDLGSREQPFTPGPSGATPDVPPFTNGMPDFGPLGARPASRASVPEVANLRVAGLDPNGATLLWGTPRQATFSEISLQGEDGKVIREWKPAYLHRIFGEQFDITHWEPAFYASERHAALGDLKPDTAYRAVVTAVSRNGRRSEPVAVSFRTPREPAKPTTWHISPNGTDTADGRTPETAWASFAHTFAQVRPGDEVLLQPGVYREILCPRVGGVKARPIRIRAAKPLTAILTPNPGTPVAVEILNTQYLQLEGLFFSGATGHNGTFCTINHAPGITIRDCEMDYPEGGTFDKLKLGYNGVVADEAPELRVENNLFIGAGVNVAASRAPGAIIRHNTFIGHGNYGVVILAGSAEETALVTDNLFERTTFGYKTNPSLWVFPPLPRLTSDHNLFHIPAEGHKGTIGKLPDTERLGPLTVWQKETGFDTHSLFAEPRFTAPEKRDFALAPGSPGKGAAGDGGDIGYRPSHR